MKHYNRNKYFTKCYRDEGNKYDHTLKDIKIRITDAMEQ